MDVMIDELYLEDLGDFVTVYCYAEIDHQNPDYSTWDSDIDYYGYTEVTDIREIDIKRFDENGDFVSIDVDSLSEKDKEKLLAELEAVAIEEFDPSDRGDYNCEI